MTDLIFQRIIEEESQSYRQRQKLIKEIQTLLGKKVIVYTASTEHPFAAIMPQDVLIFEDLLLDSESSTKGVLIINSPGGELNAAEKILMMCRERFNEEFNVVIPNYAKSAATLIALGSDKILMGYLSEIGPVDPQIEVIAPGVRQLIPARAFIEGLDSIRKKVREGDPPQLYLPMIAQIPPQLIPICENAIKDSGQLTEKWLKSYMFRNDPNQAKVVAEKLSDGKSYTPHGKVIDYKEAKNILNLNVELIDRNSDMWKKLWELYCRSVEYLKIQNKAKLFESENASISMGVEAALLKPNKK